MRPSTKNQRVEMTDSEWSPTVDAHGRVLPLPYPSIENWRQALAVIDGMWSRIERQENSIEQLKRALLAMQPRYHTLMHTFKNEAEANMAWQALNIALHGPDKPIPPMPVGPQYTSPYVHKDGSPVIPQYPIKKFEGIDIGTDSH
jgi:hypothetical protein